MRKGICFYAQVRGFQDFKYFESILFGDVQNSNSRCLNSPFYALCCQMCPWMFKSACEHIEFYRNINIFTQSSLAKNVVRVAKKKTEQEDYLQNSHETAVLNLWGQRSEPAVPNRFANRHLFYLLCSNVHFVFILCKQSIGRVSLFRAVFAEMAIFIFLSTAKY